LLKAGGAGLSALALGTPLFATEARRRPNVLLITTDQQCIDVMGAVGNKWAKTPHMDSIAAQGVYFTKSYCIYPLCSPSRSSLHTGRTPHEDRVDVNGVAIDPAIPISGQAFRKAGYDTGYAGKWHCPAPFPTAGIAGYEVLNKVERRNAELAHDIDQRTVGEAVDFLGRKRNQPFLLVASFLNPHDICMLAGDMGAKTKELWKRYGPKGDAELPPLPSNAGLTAGRPAALQPAKHEDWDEHQWRRYRYAYFRLLEDVDRQVGQVLEALRRSGQEENTLVIFTSDHGEGLGAHHWTGKLNFFDEEAAVPLIVSWKGVTPAGRINREHLASTLDFLPTICDYAGVPLPAETHGQTLRPTIQEPAQASREFVVSEMAMAGAGGRGRSFMLRSAKHKYMVFSTPQGRPAEMFFDMEADPGEMKNLSGDPALASEVERHRQLLAQWNKTTREVEYPIAHGGTAKKGRAKRSAKAARPA
jgi:arylsulfatase A-like enzyme